MTKPPKRPRDPNQLAKLIVDIAAGETLEPENQIINEKARLAGLKGGEARAKSLTEGRRSEIAKLAAQKRWQNRA